MGMEIFPPLNSGDTVYVPQATVTNTTTNNAAATPVTVLDITGKGKLDFLSISQGSSTLTATATITIDGHDLPAFQIPVSSTEYLVLSGTFATTGSNATSTTGLNLKFNKSLKITIQASASGGGSPNITSTIRYSLAS